MIDSHPILKSTSLLLKLNLLLALLLGVFLCTIGEMNLAEADSSHYVNFHNIEHSSIIKRPKLHTQNSDSDSKSNSLQTSLFFWEVEDDNVSESIASVPVNKTQNFCRFKLAISNKLYERIIGLLLNKHLNARAREQRMLLFQVFRL